PLGIGDEPAGTGEIRIERRIVLIDAVVVPAGRVRLPYLHQDVRNRFAVLVEYASADEDPLAQRLALVLRGEVVVGGLDVVVAENRRRDLRKSVRKDNERLSRRSLDGRRVFREQVLRLRIEVWPSVRGD